MSENESSKGETRISFSKLAPFDSSSADHLSMYDNLPYERNSDVCNVTAVAKESGNILKFYRCNVDSIYEVNNRDDYTSKMLARLKHEQGPVTAPETPAVEVLPPSGGITEEQMDELFRDNKNE